MSHQTAQSKQALAAASASTTCRKVNWAPEPMVHDAQSLFPPEQVQYLAVAESEGKNKTVRVKKRNDRIYLARLSQRFIENASIHPDAPLRSKDEPQLQE